MATILENTIGGITGQTGARASRRAGDIQAGAFKEASAIEVAGQEESRKQLLEQLGITREQFSPFIEAGTAAIGGFQEASTAGGLDALLNEIMGGDVFGGLIEERQRGVQGQLAAGGLTRSGVAIEEAARLPTDLALELEGLLTGRKQNIAGMGLSAIGQESGISSNLMQGIVNAITGGARAESQGITGAAGAKAQGILGAAQSRTQGIQNLLNLSGTLAWASIMKPDGAAS